MTANLNTVRAQLTKAVGEATERLQIFEALVLSQKNGLIPRETLDSFVATLDGAATAPAKIATMPPPAPIAEPKRRGRKPNPKPEAEEVATKTRGRKQAPNNLMAGIKSVMKNKVMSGVQVYEALKAKNFPINSDNPLRYVRYTLSANSGKDSALFRRVSEYGKGHYQVLDDMGPKSRTMQTAAPAGRILRAKKPSTLSEAITKASRGTLDTQEE